MNSLHHDLARALQAEHLAAARQRHLADEVRRARRHARREERAADLGWFRRWRLRPERSGRFLSVAVAPPAEAARPVDVPAELTALLDGLADRIMELGTGSEAASLAALSRAAAGTSPGAAAALVDRDGAEVARLRAFGIVQGVVLHELSLRQQSSLLDRLTGSDDLPLVG